MSFNPDPRKQAQEVFFLRKLQKISHPSIYFNDNRIEQVSSQKHLGMTLDTKLNFQEHIKNILKSIKLLDYYGSCKTSSLEDHYLLQYLNRLPGAHLDYGAVIYDHSYKNTFHQKMESIHYNAALVVTGVIRASSSEKIIKN